MSLLVGRFVGYDPLQRFDGRYELASFFVQFGQFDEQRKTQSPQFLPPALCPLLVAILGQQITRVQLQRSPVGGRLPRPTGRSSHLLEGVDVHP